MEGTADRDRPLEPEEVDEVKELPADSDIDPEDILTEPIDEATGAPRSGSALINSDMAPGLVRLAGSIVWQTNLWTAQTALRVARRLAEAAASGESAGALVDDARHEIADAGRRLLGIRDSQPNGEGRNAARGRDFDDRALRARWADLVEMSTGIEVDEVDGHPAFAGILRDLHPDEARILRLLATEGPQAAVDVRTWRPLGIGSERVAPGLNMIGPRAGCLFVERVPVYLSNLFRLGLIWFSRDAIPEIGPYQVLEAQPEVTEALKRAGRGTTVRRSILLTPFGEQFCKAALPEDTDEFDAVVTARPFDEVPPQEDETQPGL